MKKAVMIFSLLALLSAGTLNFLSAQEKPKPEKDTVNIDTDAKPTYYYAVEDEESGAKSGNSATLIAIAGGVVVLGVAGYFLLRKKK